MSSAEAPATPWRLYVRKVLRRDLADFVGSEGDRAAPTPRIIGFVLARFMQRSCVALLLRMAVGREDPLPISHGSGPLLLLGPERGAHRRWRTTPARRDAVTARSPDPDHPMWFTVSAAGGTQVVGGPLCAGAAVFQEEAPDNP